MIVDLFAGPGGWDEALRRLGRTDVVGIDVDPWACATAAAAGHRRIQADIAGYPAGHLRGHVEGLIASPPCPAFSSAGKKLGRSDVPAIRAHLHAAGRGGWTAPAAAWADPTSALTLEPLRWVLATRPNWVALEQVPAVLTLWQTYALVLENLGYLTWCGVVDAADYGVPQNRRRAIFTAHRSRRLSRPATTHRDRHVAMADALGLDRFTVLNTGRDWKPGGTRVDAQELVAAGPAPAVAGVPSQWRWVTRRPARTITGTVGGRFGQGPATADGSTHVNVTVAEALVLQDFPADYPIAGDSRQRWKQVGDAVPPGLAVAVLAPLLKA